MNDKQWFDRYFCGCGDPKKAAESFKEFMGIYEKQENGFFINLDQLKEFEQKYSEGMALLLLYFIDGTGLTEHGGSVYGSWLTDLGLDVKNSLELGNLFDESKEKVGNFWMAVLDCLKMFHDKKAHEARQMIEDYRKSFGELESDLCHEDPFMVACEIAGTRYEIAPFKQDYEKILDNRSL